MRAIQCIPREIVIKMLISWQNQTPYPNAVPGLALIENKEMERIECSDSERGCHQSNSSTDIKGDKGCLLHRLTVSITWDCRKRHSADKIWSPEGRAHHVCSRLTAKFYRTTAPFGDLLHFHFLKASITPPISSVHHQRAGPAFKTRPVLLPRHPHHCCVLLIPQHPPLPSSSTYF